MSLYLKNLVEKISDPNYQQIELIKPSTEEGKEMIDKLEDFLMKNKWDTGKLKYFIGMGHKFKDKKIAKDFKKHNPTVMIKNSEIDYAKDKELLYKKNSLNINYSI